MAPEDNNPRRLIEYLEVKLQSEYGATPAFFLGTLEEALNAATSDISKEKVRLRVLLMTNITSHSF